MGVKFGPAGNSESFTERGYKKSKDIPRYIVEMGLEAYEYQCGRGVKIGEATASELMREAAIHGVTLTLHAPYYISLASADEDKRLNSINYILQSAKAIKLLGGDRIVVHAGSVGDFTRETALGLACDTMKKAMSALAEQGLSDVRVCIEAMGKQGQLGTVEEVCTMCAIDDTLLPCLDFGHVNARTLGSIKTKDDYNAIMTMVEDRLGIDRLKQFHCHFSKIEYTKGGEKRHLTFEDTVFGPDFEPFIEIVAQKGLEPIIICESDGTQAEDAATMKRYYQVLKAQQ